MTAPSTKNRMTFEEYLQYEDGTENQYEFVDGALVEMPPESPLNSRIARFLLTILLNRFSEDQVCYKDTEIAIAATPVRVRLPDLMLLSDELAAILAQSNRGTIVLDMPPPELIIEVVSPGKTNAERDYQLKRTEYASRGVLEYWVIDPITQTITVFSLNQETYQAAIFTENQTIASRISVLNLTAAQILNRSLSHPS